MAALFRYNVHLVHRLGVHESESAAFLELRGDHLSLQVFGHHPLSFNDVDVRTAPTFVCQAIGTGGLRVTFAKTMDLNIPVTTATLRFNSTMQRDDAARQITDVNPPTLPVPPAAISPRARAGPTASGGGAAAESQQSVSGLSTQTSASFAPSDPAHFSQGYAGAIQERQTGHPLTKDAQGRLNFLDAPPAAAVAGAGTAQGPPSSSSAVPGAGRATRRAQWSFRRRGQLRV
jgi:hypothetical protein